MASTGSARVKVLLLGDNSNQVVQTKTFSRSKLAEFLTDPGRVDCPVVRKVGLPLILVSTTPGRKVIPVAQTYAGSNNPHNNHHATQLSVRNSGWAIGCVVGPVYAVRTDGKDLTAEMFDPIWDTIMTFSMSYYGSGNVPIPAIAFEHHRKLISIWIETGEMPEHMTHQHFLAGPLPSEKGNPLHRAPTPGACHACHKKAEQAEEGVLLKCSACKKAWYCSRACQKAAWKLHKHDCAQTQLEVQLQEAEQQLRAELGLPTQQLQQQQGGQAQQAAVPERGAGYVNASPSQTELDAAVLRPEQVLYHNVEVSQMSASSMMGIAPDVREGVTKLIGQDLMQILEYNRSQNELRVCPNCYTLYRLRSLPAANMTRYDKEQRLSGICGYGCWRTMNPDNGSPCASADWYGQEAVMPAGVMLNMGQGVVLGRRGGDDDA